MGVVRVRGRARRLLLPALATAQQAAPKFQPEPFWPKPLPENWILGQVAGIAVDGQDNIWIIHRPATLLDDEKGAQANPPETKCCKVGAAGFEIRSRRQSARLLGRRRPRASRG